MDELGRGVLLADSLRVNGHESAQPTDDNIIGYMVDYGQLRMMLCEIKREGRDGNRKCVIEQYAEAARLAAVRIPERFRGRLTVLRELEEFYPDLLC